MQRRISRYRGTIKTKKKKLLLWLGMIDSRYRFEYFQLSSLQKIARDIYACKMPRYKPARPRIIYQLAFQITQARDYPRRDKKFIFLTSEQVLSATRNITEYIRKQRNMHVTSNITKKRCCRKKVLRKVVCPRVLYEMRHLRSWRHVGVSRVIL